MRTFLTLALLSLVACGDDDGTIVVDAGTDSGVSDGGRMDASSDPGDAGTDAGNDGGALDAGEDAGADAGDLDAGSDAGDLDAGDAAGSDAGPPCIEIPGSTDPAVVLMGELSATGTVWMRPEEGETAICEEVAMGDLHVLRGRGAAALLLDHDDGRRR